MGVQQVLLSADTGAVSSANITVGNAASVFGYNTGIGSFTGSLACPLYAGATFTAVQSDSVDDFLVTASSTLTGQAGAFNSIQVQDHTGAVRTYTAGSATYSAGTWRWGTGSNPVFNTAAQVRTFVAS